MQKSRTSSVPVRTHVEGFPRITHYNNGPVAVSATSPTPAVVTWDDSIADSAPTRPVYTSVLRSAFQWKARYGTPEARAQRLLALDRRATLAHNRQLRAKFYSDLARYQTAVNRFGTYNPISGVVALGSSPIFRPCTNVQTKIRVVSSGSHIFVSNRYWLEPSGWTSYTTHDGPVSIMPPWFFKDQQSLTSFPGTFTAAKVMSSKVAQVISKTILNDSRLMNINGGAFSILTFLAELKDLKSLPSLLKKWTRSSHDISDKYLGVSFGVLPFYSDICAILDRLNNLPYAIEEWNRQADEAKIRSYHCTIDPNKVGASYNGPTPMFRRVESEVYRFNGKPVYQYGVTTLTQRVKVRGHVYLLPRRIDESKISALKKHIWGTNSILGTVWELVPFSFVVDWFLHLGPLIQNLEEVDNLLCYRIIDAGYSIKVESNWNTKHGSSPGSADLFECECTGTEYKRVPLSPASLGPSQDEPYQITGLNISQSILSAALTHQQLKR